MKSVDNHAQLLVRGGHVVTAAGIEKADIAIRGGKIVDIGDLGTWSADKIVDAVGLHVLPGVIDTQVHLREPGLCHKENLEAGTRGAVLGGVTSVFEMPNTNPLTLTAHDLNAKLAAANGRAWCDFAFYIGGSAANLNELSQLEMLPGCAGIKVFMGSSFGDLLASEDKLLREILRNGRRRMSVHAEDEARLRERRHIVETSRDVRDHPLWRDVESAFKATRRIVDLAIETNRRLHVLHVSTGDEIAFLTHHKKRVSVEVLPHHLTMSAPECYERLGTLAQMNPPVRDEAHRDALWRGIQTGVVDVIGSDHAPHTLEEKRLGYPNSPSGMTGVQTLLPIMLNHVHQGRLSLQRLCDLMSAGPSRLFGIAGKGRIAVGFDGDLTLVDLATRREIRNDWIASVAGWTPYDGTTVTGWPIATIIRGHVAMLHDEVVGSPVGRAISFVETSD